ncbi:gag/pol protein [Cucumis melo var. makuwa]|uniref:Gag/pol protein n=1 Tax=Cucumis melo var. makuwa TaxID=1194695 RepID=A0A5A7ST67_CUCMM|nr:gag/pol protein [Cucumis melo var. makuwa]TYJ98733.1 gag/pol protein [Cucumis melo var. makuwa]
MSSIAFLWHLRLAHINLNKIGKLVKNGLLSQLEDNSLPSCDSYLEGKMTQRSFTGIAQIIIPDDGIEDPLTYKQAMNDVDCNQWIKAIDLEMESMYSNSIWTLVDQPNDVKPIDCKWIYKRKRDQAAKVQNSKARLVAKGIVSRYQSNPGHDHWTAVKNTPKYLRRTKDYMLVYGYKDQILTGYTDSNFQSDKNARKFTSGSVFTLNGRAVVKRSIKQSCIADSTMEAEYVAVYKAAKKVVWLKKFLTDLEVVPNMHLTASANHLIL